MKILNLAIITIVILCIVAITDLQVFGNTISEPIYAQNTTMSMNIQSEPTPFNLKPPQDRQLHLGFFDANNNLIKNMTISIAITRENQQLLTSIIHSNSGRLTLNLQASHVTSWSVRTDYDSMGVNTYGSLTDDITIDVPTQIRNGTYHFEIQPMVFDEYNIPKIMGIKFATDLDILDTFNKTITPIIISAATQNASLQPGTEIASIDGTVSLKGCNVIHGTITQTTDIQNSTIQVCDYHGRHFKLVDYDACILISWAGKITDPQTGMGYDFPLACDIPTTCNPKDSWWGYVMGHPEKLPVVVNDIQQYIIINYGSEMCASESYDAQGKRVTIIANPIQENRTNISALIPKDLVGNITSVKVDGKSITPYVTDYPTHNAVPACPESCYNVEIQLPISSTPEKIEIGGESIPEFPFAVLILLISFVSVIVLYRIRFRK